MKSCDEGGGEEREGEEGEEGGRRRGEGGRGREGGIRGERLEYNN